jgi:hypothetical protein
MEVTAGGSDAGMAEGGLDQVDRGAAVKGVGSVSVAEPVRGDGQFDAVAAGGFADDAQDGHGFQRGAMLARPEHGFVLAGFSAQFREVSGDRSRQLDGAGFAALAEDGDLGAVAVGLHVAPVKPADFADAHAGRVEQ